MDQLFSTQPLIQATVKAAEPLYNDSSFYQQSQSGIPTHFNVDTVSRANPLTITLPPNYKKIHNLAFYMFEVTVQNPAFNFIKITSSQIQGAFNEQALSDGRAIFIGPAFFQSINNNLLVNFKYQATLLDDSFDIPYSVGTIVLNILDENNNTINFINPYRISLQIFYDR